MRQGIMLIKVCENACEAMKITGLTPPELLNAIVDGHEVNGFMIGINGRLSEPEIAKLFEISHTKVNQIRHGALDKLYCSEDLHDFRA